MFFESQIDNVAVIENGVQYMSIVATMSFGLFGSIILERLLQATGNTIYSNAINRAGIALRTLGSLVDKKHIIIVSDGMVTSGDTEYQTLTQTFYDQDGITLSVLGVGITEGTGAYTDMKTLTELGHGRLMCPTTSQLITEMRKELKADEIKEVNLTSSVEYEVNKMEKEFNRFCCSFNCVQWDLH